MYRVFKLKTARKWITNLKCFLGIIWQLLSAPCLCFQNICWYRWQQPLQPCSLAVPSEAVRPIAFQCLSSVFHILCECQLATGNHREYSVQQNMPATSRIRERSDTEGQQRNSGGSYSPDYITGIKGSDQILWSPDKRHPAGCMVALRMFFWSTFDLCRQNLHVFFYSNNFIMENYPNLNCLTSMANETEGYMNFAGRKARRDSSYSHCVEDHSFFWCVLIEGNRSFSLKVSFQQLLKGVSQ